MDPDVLAWVRRIREDRADQHAVHSLERFLRPRLAAYFAHGPWPAHEAEDLVQKTLALVFTRVDTLEEPDRFVGWLFAIARNVRHTAAGHWIERRGVEVGLSHVEDDRSPPAAGNALSAAIAGQRRSSLAAAILELPSRQRQCLLLRVREEMSYEEIAKLLRLSPLTVRNHIAQAKESLRRAIAGAKEDGG